MNSDRDLLGQLLAQIERAWVDRHDRMLVYELSERHPELRDQLYEFFEDLVLGPTNDINSEYEVAEDRIHQWLQTTGIEIARSAAQQEWATRATNRSTTSPNLETKEETALEKTNEPLTFLVFLRRRVGKSLSELAESLPNMTTEFLVLISRHPGLLPRQIKQEFAQLVEERWQISPTDSFTYLAGEPQILRAASRQKPFKGEPTSFQELLDRAKLTVEQKTFWLNLMK